MVNSEEVLKRDANLKRVPPTGAGCLTFLVLEQLVDEAIGLGLLGPRSLEAFHGLLEALLLELLLELEDSVLPLSEALLFRSVLLSRSTFVFIFSSTSFSLVAPASASALLASSVASSRAASTTVSRRLSSLISAPFRTASAVISLRPRSSLRLALRTPRARLSMLLRLRFVAWAAYRKDPLRNANKNE